MIRSRIASKGGTGKGTRDSSSKDSYSSSSRKRLHRLTQSGRYYFVITWILLAITIAYNHLGIGVMWRSLLPEQSLSNTSNRIIYKLNKNTNFEDKFDSGYKCVGDKYTGPRKETSPHFSKDGVMDFQTEMSTSLNILVVGDSVAMQFSQALQEASGANSTDGSRRVLHYSWRKHEGVTLATGVNGGGAIGGFRITGLFSRKQRDNSFQLPPTPGGGWMTEHVELLRDGLRNHSIGITDLTDNPGISPKDNFDVVLHQFPFGWLEWNKKKLPVESFFTKESLQEVISASHEVFGATTVILQTVPLLNNVKDMKDQLMVINSVIYEVANQYVPSKENGVQKVLVMDLAWLSFNLFAHNAVGLGVSNPSILEKLKGRDGSGKKGRAAKLVVDELNPLLGQRHDCCHAEVKEIVPFACGELVEYSTKYCQRNVFSYDGLHWCMNKMAGRINGGVSCLLGCAYNNDFSGDDLRKCEMTCNDIYMSLKAIDFNKYGRDGVVVNF